MRIDSISDTKPIIASIEKGGIVLIPSTETYNSPTITYNSSTTRYNGDTTVGEEGKRIYVDSISDITPKQIDIAQL